MARWRSRHASHTGWSPSLRCRCSQVLVRRDDLCVTQWLNAERVARAQQLLETTDMPIEAVAGEAGFGTPLSLRQQFAAQLGTTPSHYRRTFREVSRPRPAQHPPQTLTLSR